MQKCKHETITTYEATKITFTEKTRWIIYLYFGRCTEEKFIYDYREKLSKTQVENIQQSAALSGENILKIYHS